MIAPSFVFFLLSHAEDGLREEGLEGVCTGKEEPDVLAGALRRPRGSFRCPARSNTEPIPDRQHLHIYHIARRGDQMLKVPRTWNFIRICVQDPHAPF